VGVISWEVMWVQWFITGNASDKMEFCKQIYISKIQLMIDVGFGLNLDVHYLSIRFTFGMLVVSSFAMLKTKVASCNTRCL